MQHGSSTTIARCASRLVARPTTASRAKAPATRRVRRPPARRAAAERRMTTPGLATVRVAIALIATIKATAARRRERAPLRVDSRAPAKLAVAARPLRVGAAPPTRSTTYRSRMISSQAGARWPASFTGPGTDGGYFLDSADSGAASCPRKDGLYCSYGSKKCEPVLEDGRGCRHLVLLRYLSAARGHGPGLHQEWRMQERALRRAALRGQPRGAADDLHRRLC